MSKRVGYVYEQMWDWDNLVHAEYVSTTRKMRNPGVKRHIAKRMSNLIEIQQMMIEGRMRTDEYSHELRVSGQNKLRDIAKLHFHPSHIQHQSLTIAATRRTEQAMIRQTYASRKGYGQLRCALEIKKNLAKYRGSTRWYAQGDICKYYENISHTLIRECMERLFKDKKFVEAFMEPFSRFSDTGKSIPLGIRPSQIIGNLVLCRFDHFMQEENKASDYVRYLDDFFFTGATKGEVKRKMKRAIKYLEQMGFKLHEPKIHRISEGVDMMGYIQHGKRNDMMWRKSDKVNWLRRRARVSNPKRLRELDDAAWGMLKWGNSHCKRLWQQKTGRQPPKKRGKMSIKLKQSGIQRKENCDANGVPYIDAPKIGMQMLLSRPVEVMRWVKNIKTSQGEGRYALLVQFMGAEYKLIVNSIHIKNFLDDMERNNVTRVKTVFVDQGSYRYNIDENNTEILEVDGRRVIEKDGESVYADTEEIITFK